VRIADAAGSPQALEVQQGTRIDVPPPSYLKEQTSAEESLPMTPAEEPATEAEIVPLPVATPVDETSGGVYGDQACTAIKGTTA